MKNILNNMIDITLKRNNLYFADVYKDKLFI